MKIENLAKYNNMKRESMVERMYNTIKQQNKLKQDEQNCKKKFRISLPFGVGIFLTSFVFTILIFTLNLPIALIVLPLFASFAGMGLGMYAGYQMQIIKMLGRDIAEKQTELDEVKEVMAVKAELEKSKDKKVLRIKSLYKNESEDVLIRHMINRNSSVDLGL